MWLVVFRSKLQKRRGGASERRLRMGRKEAREPPWWSWKSLNQAATERLQPNRLIRQVGEVFVKIQVAVRAINQLVRGSYSPQISLQHLAWLLNNNTTKLPKSGLILAIRKGFLFMPKQQNGTASLFSIGSTELWIIWQFCVYWVIIKHSSNNKTI